MRDSQITGRFHNVNPVVLRQHKKVYKLPISTFALHVMHPDLVHGIWQVPIHKGRAITQGSGLAYQQRDIMPGLKVTDITGNTNGINF